jgi:oligopeptide transport system permease protein
MNALGETIAAEQALEEAERGTSLWRDAWHRLGKNKMAVISALVLILIALAAFIGPLFLAQSY